MNNIKRLKWNCQSDRSRLVDILLSQGVVVGDSDTICGLLVAATSAGRRALDTIKHRYNKPYLILVPSLDSLQVLISPEQFSYIAKWVHKCWPGPLTLILKARPGLPSYLQSEKRTIAVRIPNHFGLLEVLNKVPLLFSTSANKAEEAVPASIDIINEEIIKQVSAIVSNNDSTRSTSSPSTILDCTRSVPHLVREGAYSIGQLKNIIGDSVSQ